MFNSRFKKEAETELTAILAKHNPESLLKDLLLTTSDHEERVKIIDKVRRQAPQIISTIYVYLESGSAFEMPPGANKARVANVINELECSMLKQEFEKKTDIDLAVYSPRPGRSN